MTQEQLVQNFQTYQAISGISAGVTPQFHALIEQGWQAVYAALFDIPEKPFVSRLAPHHREAIEWHWNARLALIKGEKPDYWAYFPIWSRGHMKSTIAKRVAIVDALVSAAFFKPAYILYVSRNKEMSAKHAGSIETILSSETVKNFCPGISQVKRNEQGSSKGWKATFLNTSVGVVFHFGGLDEGLAGGNVDDVRPTMIIPDDIDGRESSPTEGENRFNKLTSEVLPMRQHDTLTFYAQNLINRYSVMYRIQSGQKRVLTNRKPTQPIPAVINPVFTTKTVDGIVKDIIVDGIPTWAYYSLERCQEEIETIGLPAFLRECQHDVEQSKEGLIAKNYDDSVHVISESEFAAMYGSPDAWKTWAKWHLNDWANTNTEKHANVAAWLTVSSQNTDFPGITFVRPFTFPAQSEPEDVAERLLTDLTPFAYGRTTWATVRREAHQRANSEKHAPTFSERLRYERSEAERIIPQYSRPVLDRCNSRGGTMGHSDPDELKVYNFGYGFRFQAVNPGKTGGISILNQSMKVDYTLAHPFRESKMGYTRWFIIAPDDPNDPNPRTVKDITVYRPKPYPTAVRPDELKDSDRCRYQLSNWRYRDATLTATGEVIDDPLKIDDDFGQMFQMFYVTPLMRNVPLTERETLAQALTEDVRPLLNKRTLTMGEQLALMDQLDEAKERISRMHDPRNHSFGYEGELVPPANENLNKSTLDVNGFDTTFL